VEQRSVYSLTVDRVSVNTSAGQSNLGNDLVSNVQEVGWTPEPVWIDVENLAHTGVRSRARPASSVVAKPTTLRAVTELIDVYFLYHTKTTKTTLGRDSQLMLYVTSFGI